MASLWRTCDENSLEIIEISKLTLLTVQIHPCYKSAFLTIRLKCYMTGRVIRIILLTVSTKMKEGY